MFVITVTFEVAPGQISAFRPLMLENARLSLEREAACQRFDVCESADRPNEIFLYEVYDDAAAFDAHLNAAHFLAFSEATDQMVVGKTVQKHALIGP